MSDQSTSAQLQPNDLQAINAVNDTGFNSALGLEFTEIGPDLARARWTVTPSQHQPYGIVHGGVYCAVIESVASVAAANWLGDKGNVVGVNNNTDFLRATRDGVLTATGTPVHRGRTQQLWRVVITDEQDRTVAQGQVRLANITDAARIGH
ncbi:PaaI family thioesterase [Rhodococcus sp. Z13]|uniref:PaaI family thioesterase n=1 Tax=Rhodococcus sacchari TaxID=2962047 RepID=A0ACD4DB60_9NOCA|nr:PaaI family thioesterase [Rhodococcus sp. Z13]UYP17274.1 PaaI family thioesterase [Rhodococcus sp. Z13]